MAKPISEDKRNMILSGNLFHAILMLAVPVMINSFIQSMYNLTDTFWLGKIGTENQSAITLVSPFQNILINFGNGITTAGAILISQYLGAREDEQANSMANHICLTSLCFSVISRTGYTGEDGFEIYASHAFINEQWDKLMASGRSKPCGLGCHQ